MLLIVRRIDHVLKGDLNREFFKKSTESFLNPVYRYNAGFEWGPRPRNLYSLLLILDPLNTRLHLLIILEKKEGSFWRAMTILSFVYFYFLGWKYLSPIRLFSSECRAFGREEMRIGAVLMERRDLNGGSRSIHREGSFWKPFVVTPRIIISWLVHL